MHRYNTSYYSFTNNKRERLVLIACYMGKLPWYFNYFVHSCRFNPTVDFYFVGDNFNSRKEFPDNVHVVQCTLSEFSSLASDRLGFSVDIKHPYKLCDFKPTYGLLFSELLVNYDFWGYADIDIIFGNIRNFITEDILQGHDLISVRHDFLTGYFQLFRNSEKMKELFRRSKDYKMVLQSDRHFCFDETNFKFDEFAAGKPYEQINSEIESMMHVVKKAEQENYLKAFFDFFVVEGIPGNLKWANGNLYYRKKFEILLYHMIHFKKKYNPIKIPTSIPERFAISRNRIYCTSPLIDWTRI